MATANTAAISLASASYRRDAELFPSREVLANSTTYEVLDPRSLQLRERILQSLMRQHESQ
jgi:spermidine/putrescine transport system substrate-binding protein